MKVEETGVTPGSDLRNLARCFAFWRSETQKPRRSFFCVFLFSSQHRRDAQCVSRVGVREDR